MTTTIQAIETEYAGCRFRSRIEARWAVFFDALELEWQHEPEGFELPSGRYLPDFWLPSVLVNPTKQPGSGRGMYFEVKGRTPTVDEFWKMIEVEDATGFAGAIAWGNIPDPTKVDDYGASSEGPSRSTRPYHFRTPGAGRDQFRLNDALDGYPGWGIRACCGQVFFGIPSGRLACGCGPRGWGHPALKAAYGAARSARFEFGDPGITPAQVAVIRSTRLRQETA